MVDVTETPVSPGRGKTGSGHSCPWRESPKRSNKNPVIFLKISISREGEITN
jgi:hypothetical protein